MQKKLFLNLNLILLAALVTCIYIYMEISGRLVMRGVTASCFVALGLVNGSRHGADGACLCTYFPGQGILAHAGYWHVKKCAE